MFEQHVPGIKFSHDVENFLYSLGFDLLIFKEFLQHAKMLKKLILYAIVLKVMSGQRASSSHKTRWSPLLYSTPVFHKRKRRRIKQLVQSQQVLLKLTNLYAYPNYFVVGTMKKFPLFSLAMRSRHHNTAPYKKQISVSTTIISQKKPVK